MRGESSCFRLPHDALTLHCQSIKFQGHAELPRVSAKPIVFAYLLCLPRSTLKVLTERCGTVSAGRWSVRAPPTSGEYGAPLAQPGTPHNYSRTSREKVVQRRWMLPGSQVDSYVCMFVFFVCHGGEECNRHFNIGWHLKTHPWSLLFAYKGLVQANSRGSRITQIWNLTHSSCKLPKERVFSLS